MGPRKRPISDEFKDTVSKLYPHINEKRTPLPRYWSHEDKCDHLGLSNGNLIVTYKGQGVEKSHKDAGSVRTAVPIPTGIGIYYFEIFIISKGRDGFMGIGISPTSQSNLNRLPGWDKDSYGYHGDDGNSFCSKGSGQPYGPTFTTGDTVGCGVNFVDRTCFFTKNGINLGSVVTDLPLRSFYPTVGLQTPGETVEANFGQKPFVFDLSDLKFEAKYFINKAVSNRPVQRSQLQSLVSSYLIHRGYSNAAASFASQTGLAVPEGMQSIENRNHLEKLVMEGSISEALKETEKRYPTLLNDNPKLEFLLKCRHFVELIMSGSQESIESSQSSSGSGNAQCNGVLNGVSVGAQQEGARPETELQPQDNLHLNGVSSDNSNSTSNGAASIDNEITIGAESNENSSDEILSSSAPPPQVPEVESLEPTNQIESQDSNGSCDMELDSNSCHATVPESTTQSSSTEACTSSSGLQNGETASTTMSEEEAKIMRAIVNGRKLRQLADKVIASGDCHADSIEQHLLEVFGLLAYDKPEESPLKHVLEPTYRESVCNMLNGAILQSHNMAADPQLQTLMVQSATCLQEMSALGIPEAAFITMKDMTG